jgi:peptidoglycan/LPS O-acetylase OafA/YrhL
MNKVNYPGITYLRAICSIVVVILHSGGFPHSQLFVREQFTEHRFQVWDVLNFYALLLAVPIFFLISNFLFALKQPSGTELVKLLTRLGKITIFWTFCQLIFIYGRWNLFSQIPRPGEADWIIRLISYVLSAGHTLYYFMISLMLLSIVVFLVQRLPIHVVQCLLVLSIVLVGSLPILAIKWQLPRLTVFWNPLQFLPYPLAAVVIAQAVREQKNLLTPNWLFLTIISIAVGIWLDWNRYVNVFFFEGGNYALPAYCRPSLVLLAMLIFNLALSVTGKVPTIIQFMADHSLALYCLHFFFIEPALSQTGADYRGLAVILIVVASYCSTWILRKFIQPDLL